MKYFKHICLLMLLLLAFKPDGKAQVDTVFWFAAPWVTPDHASNVPMAFHFSTFNNTTTVRLRQPASTYDTTFTVNANSLFTKDVTHLLDSLESQPWDSVINRGFEVTSDFPIVAVYDFMSSGNNPETYSLKGQNGLGFEFVTPFQTLWNNRTLNSDRNGDGEITQPKQFFSVVTTEDNTTIYITPRCAVEGGHPANVTYSVFLPRAGQVYTCQNLVQNTSVPGNNLAGSIVVSDKRIAVTVNDDSVNPSAGGGCYDLMGDQIVPTDVIGKDHIINKGFLNAGSNESAFIVATENFTTVTIEDGVLTTTISLNQGDTYPYSIKEQLTWITSDKNIYVLHMSGYGCELGKALIPPLNCAGSDQVSFYRSNGFRFLINLLCPAGSEDDFLIDGVSGLIPAADFAPVPGTGGAWVGAQIEYTTTQIPVGSAHLVENTTGLFSLGVINGSPTGGCLYHYLSQYNRKVITNAGTDAMFCNGEPIINLDGSVLGGTTTGIWNVLNGSGTLNAPTSLATSYVPTASDFNQGSLTFVLASTGNCDPEYDSLRIDFIESPDVTASADLTLCRNNADTIPVQSTLQYATGSTWSGGNGGAFGNTGDLTTTYTPSPSDLMEDSLNLIITSQGSFFTCPDDSDTITVYFTDVPSVVVGPDQVICSSVEELTLNGVVSGSTSTGIWTTSGSGTFDPSPNNLLTDYQVSSSDTTLSSLTLTLTSTNNGNCLAVKDSLQVTIVDKPELEITSNDSICSTLPTLGLDGTVTAGFSTTWTVIGAGNVVTPGALSTVYNISPIDTTNGFIDVLLETNGAICPIENDSIRVLFVDPPNVNAGLDVVLCENEAIQLTGVISGADTTGSWSSTGTGFFSPGNNFVSTVYQPSVNDVNSGGVTLVLTSSSVFGCPVDKDTLGLTFKESPTANFSFTSVCLGENAAFFDQSTTPVGTINIWNYDFGDQTGSIANNPLHNYQTSGNYNVRLVVGASNGCFDTITKTVNIHPIPTPNFVYGSACINNPIQVNDQSVVSSGSVVDWSYTFENGAVPIHDPNPVYTYSSSGTFQVYVEATSDLGCVGKAFIPINVLPGPTADFTANPNPALILEDIAFTDFSSTDVVRWIWDFGDGSGGIAQNEVHNYGKAGVYPVVLTVADANGCTDTIARNVEVALLPVLPTAFTPDGNGENDVFLIRGGPFESVDFKIYNNWGELVFESFDAAIGWDGMFNGVEAPVGVYSWTFKVALAGNRVVTQSGDVTLMR